MHGLLFTSDFLYEGIRKTSGWLRAEQEFITFREKIVHIFALVSAQTGMNEAQTEDDIIIPVLHALGWQEYISQEAMNPTGRHDVPDFLLFANRESKSVAMKQQRERRFRHGLLIVEAKRWGRPLDRGDNTDLLDAGTPSNQILRYLSRAEIASDRAIQWGILSNGGIWRLYWQNARSRAEEFVQFNLADLAGIAGINADLFTGASGNSNVHLLRAFYLLFRRESFLPQPGDTEGRSFHALALDESRLWEARVSQDLGQRVFDEIFPRLSAALVRNDHQALRPYSRDYLEQVHRAALIVLYRLLFVLFAEDRDLLPVHDRRYDDYSLRWLRENIARRCDKSDIFSTSATRIWQHLRSLFRAIDRGDDSLGLPPYNGGLFHEQPGDILARIELADAELAPIIDGLSRRQSETSKRVYINYRDLAVQHLGSIYERLLEQRLIETSVGDIVIQPSPFARKNSGSYYTHDDLVKLILRETITPLAQEKSQVFLAALEETKHKYKKLLPEQKSAIIAQHDPAEALLKLKVCDPAMGSGHFLVSLVDDLADRILEQLAEARALADEAKIPHYQSPVAKEILQLRQRILEQAERGRWAIEEALLDDRHLVRRMILKRVVHGVDKNPMAVELAKLALWLHTFTVGAPLSFLDHHLCCGDALYGERLATVRISLDKLGALFNDSQVAGLLQAAQIFGEINAINDIDLQEVERSRRLMEEAHDSLSGLKQVFDIWQAIRWIAPLDAPKRLRNEKHATASELFSGRYKRTLMQLLHGNVRVQSDDAKVDARVNALLDECRALAKTENFLHWELAFPGVWQNLASGAGGGGFDAIIGNPPWDRMKLQEVEWFAERRPEIARQTRAADRKAMIEALKRDHDPLAGDYALAAKRAEDGTRVARDCGEYPLLSNGDINLYALFVERASCFVQPQGIVGLLTPSGIAGDKGAANFFRSLSTTGRLAALFDFENRKGFFPDVDSRFKFCALVFGGGKRQFSTTRCAFYLHRTSDLDDSERTIELSAADFAVVNPNTGTAPIFRSRRDAELTTRIYRQHPVLVKHHFATELDAVSREQTEDRSKIASMDCLYPVRYCTMFHMTNDSDLFKSETWLSNNGGYKVAANRWRCGGEEYLPLYEGKMVQAYDHRAASVVVNPESLHRPAQPKSATAAEHQNTNWLPLPQFWISKTQVQGKSNCFWHIGFKDVTAPTNMRTVIATIVPQAGFGNTLALILPTDNGATSFLPLLLANMNSMVLDYCARQKVQGQHLNWYVVEQLPFIAPSRFEEKLGSGSIADLLRREVLHLSYTAHDLAGFARDLGYHGDPFIWDVEDRRHRMARLDALFFRLYGLNREEAAYVLDTFPIVRQADEAEFGRYRSKELILAYMNALAVGDVDAVVHG